MPTSKIPGDWIKRDDAKDAVGKSPKTVYRVIKKAIESGDEKLIVALDHCKLGLLDGGVVDGHDVTSMQQVDQYRSKGKVPTWFIDPDWFADYFKQDQHQPKPKDTLSEAGVNEPTVPTGKVEPLDSRLIEQYQRRLEEKDQQILDLKEDKTHLREELQSLTELTNKITGLLGHSQLKALGLPNASQDDTTPKNPDRAEVITLDAKTDASAEKGSRTAETSATPSTKKRKKPQTKKTSGQTLPNSRLQRWLPTFFPRN